MSLLTPLKELEASYPSLIHNGLYGLGWGAALLVIRYIVMYTAVRYQVYGLPAVHSLIELFESGFRSKLPNVPFFFPANAFTLDDPWQKYDKNQCDLFACTQLTTPDHAVYVTSSPTVAAMLAAKSSVFLKPTGMFRYQAINVFGKQIVSAQTGPEHKRHRSVVKSCFGENIMEIAWDRIVDAMGVMFQEEGVEAGGVLHDAKEAMIKVTLLVIGSAGFGIDVPWRIPSTDSDIMPFYEALDIVEGSTIAQLLLPLRFMTWSPFAGLRKLGRAQVSMLHHIRAMMAVKRKEIQSNKEHTPKGEKIKAPTDILGAIVASQSEAEEEADAGKQAGVGLTEDEIIGNIFIFIVAGHETTGHTLTFTLAYLALYPEWQEKVLEEIHEVCGDSLPSYRDLPNLRLTLAVAYEALRLRDLVMTLPKLAGEDTFIPYTTWDNDGNITHHTRLVKKGSHVIIDSPACSRNPFAWKDAKVFNPSRWLTPTTSSNVGKWEERDLGVANFTGFSAGVRVCIGKRMAEVELAAVVSHLVKGYNFLPVLKDGETREQVEKRLLTGTEELNLTPGRWGLKLERRV